MKKRSLKKLILLTTGTGIALLLVLVVHIYLVTKPKAPEPSTIAMARFDVRETIDNLQASEITNWLQQQDGIDHVLCNANTKIVVFTFHPYYNNAEHILKAFNNRSGYTAKRYLPSKEDMQAGCPVATTGFTGSIIKYISQKFNS